MALASCRFREAKRLQVSCTSMKKLLALSLVLAACSSTDNTPPPIKNGICLVYVYDGTTVERQVCTYDHYTWNCRYQFNLGRHECSRAAEIGERTPTTEIKK